MNGEPLQYVQVGPEHAANCVIWLHGLGADGYDFEPIVAELNFAAKSNTRFVFPHAPTRAITVNGGMRMRAWYDIAGLDEHSPEDESGIRESARDIEALIAAELENGIAPQRMVLAGFSQGGAMALHVGLRHVPALAGVLALSAYLPLRAKLAEELPAPAPLPALLMVHGEIDPVVPIQLAQASKTVLERQGYALEWHSYPMEHTVIPEEIDAIAHWLDGVLP